MNQLSSDQEIRGTRFNVPPETIKKQTKYVCGGAVSRHWASDNKRDPQETGN